MPETQADAYQELIKGRVNAYKLHFNERVAAGSRSSAVTAEVHLNGRRRLAGAYVGHGTGLQVGKV